MYNYDCTIKGITFSIKASWGHLEPYFKFQMHICIVETLPDEPLFQLFVSILTLKLCNKTIFYERYYINPSALSAGCIGNVSFADANANLPSAGLVYTICDINELHACYIMLKHQENNARSLV